MTLPSQLPGITDWLLQQSLQGSLVVLGIISLQWLFRHRLSSRWKAALWWVLLLRLMLPFSFESSLSLYNWVGARSSRDVTRSDALIRRSEQAGPTIVQISPSPSALEAPAVHPQPVTSQPSSAISQPTVQSTVPLSTELLPAEHGGRGWDTARRVLPIIWATGGVLLLGFILLRSWRFQRRLVRDTYPAPDRLVMLFEACRKQFGYAKQVTLLENPLVNSPALCGLRRPRLLLPVGLATQFTDVEVRYIYFHELAHLERRDLWQNWILTVLQVVHWFNPVIWLAFARLRADRELACDEEAIARSGDDSGRTYGETVVKLLERASLGGSVPGGVGILEDRALIRQRILMISRFQKRRRWSFLALALVAGLSITALTDARSPKAVEGTPVSQSTNRFDLIGEISAKEGDPLPVAPSVYIVRATPKVGAPTFSPWSYPDCGKRAKSDNDGSFVIGSLDPQLLFDVLAAAEGFQAKIVKHVDISKSPIYAELEPVSAPNPLPEQRVQGQVVDSTGMPIAGAMVRLVVIEDIRGEKRGGQVAGVDSIAATDQNGMFSLTSKTPFRTMDVQVQHPGFAPKRFNDLPTGGTPRKLALSKGVTAQGRVLADGKGVEGILVGLCGVIRAEPNFLGHFEVGTTHDGSFEFRNLPPDADYYLYTTMFSVQQRGSLPIRRVHLGVDGTVERLGDCSLQKTFRISGRVALADGRALPRNIQVNLLREQAWDFAKTKTETDGSFAFEAVPSGSVKLIVQAAGFRLSALNQSLDPSDSASLRGFNDGSSTNLLILIEPGDPTSRSGPITAAMNENLLRQPLRGAELGDRVIDGWKITGRVLDSTTEKPITRFRVRLGRRPPWMDDYEWEEPQPMHDEEGYYTIFIPKSLAHPALQFSADGYLPTGSPVLPVDQAGLDQRLTPGAGPHGRVLSPEGKPVHAAPIAQIGTSRNGASIRPNGSIHTKADDEPGFFTQEDGGFNLDPQFGTTHLMVYAQAGFALVPLTNLNSQSVIRLQRYGRIEGTLRRGADPAPNLGLYIELGPSRGAHVNNLGYAVTDAEGKFVFDRVPPGVITLILQHREALGAIVWKRVVLKEFEVEAGVTTKLSAVDAGPLPPVIPVQNSEPAAKEGRIPGEWITGIVVGVDGKPASGVDVGLQLPDMSHMIGAGKLMIDPSPTETVTQTDTNGHFKLPRFRGAKSLIAVCDAGIAQVSIRKFNTTSKIHLERWVTIEGQLLRGHQPLAETTVSYALIEHPFPTTAEDDLQPPSIYPFSRVTMTDSRGRFLFRHVPPGKLWLTQDVRVSENFTAPALMRKFQVEPGSNIQIVLGETDRTARGTADFGSDLFRKLAEQAWLRFVELPPGFLEAEAETTRSDQDRGDLISKTLDSPIVSEARTFPAVIGAKGTFELPVIAPGRYLLTVQLWRTTEGGEQESLRWASRSPVTIPSPSGHSNTVVQLGAIPIQRIPAAKASAH